MVKVLGLFLVACSAIGCGGGGAGDVHPSGVSFNGANPQSLKVGTSVHVTSSASGVMYWVIQTEGPAECIAVTTNGSGYQYGADCFIRSSAPAAGVLHAATADREFATVPVRWVN